MLVTIADNNWFCFSPLAKSDCDLRLSVSIYRKGRATPGVSLFPCASFLRRKSARNCTPHRSSAPFVHRATNQCINANSVASSCYLAPKTVDRKLCPTQIIAGVTWHAFYEFPDERRFCRCTLMRCAEKPHKTATNRRIRGKVIETDRPHSVGSQIEVSLPLTGSRGGLMSVLSSVCREQDRGCALDGATNGV